MKKIIFALTLFCLTSDMLSAQQFRFGLTASPVFDWLKIDGTTFSNDGLKIGFQYGLLLDQTIGNVERYAFSTGFIINYVGESFSGTDSNGTTLNVVPRVQYIEIPLTIKLRTNEINYITYYGLFGFTPGFNIKARGDFNVDPDPANISVQDINLRDDNMFDVKYNLINLNLTLGVGLEYAMSENTAIIGGLFFQNGFTNVINDKVDDDNAQLKQIGIRLGVLF